MNRCPGCAYIVPAAWTECRRCGTPLAFAQSPPPPPPTRARVLAPARFGPADDALLPGAAFPGGASRDVGPDTMLPIIEPVITVAPTRGSRVNGRTIVIGAVLAMCALGAALALIPHGAQHTAAGPVLLDPEAPFAGLPTSLSAVVRIEAESSRHTALSVVISAASPNGAPLTAAQLTGLQPGYQWVLGNVPSTTNTVISITSANGSDVVAVSGTNRSICAYGRWSLAAGSTYVTMDHVTTCNAISAPTTGWSTLPGGTAQDLPDANGN